MEKLRPKLEEQRERLEMDLGWGGGWIPEGPESHHLSPPMPDQCLLPKGWDVKKKAVFLLTMDTGLSGCNSETCPI